MHFEDEGTAAWNAAGGNEDALFATTENGCQYKYIRG